MYGVIYPNQMGQIGPMCQMGPTGGRTDGQTGGRTDGWTDGRTEFMDRRTDFNCAKLRAGNILEGKSAAIGGCGIVVLYME